MTLNRQVFFKVAIIVLIAFLFANIQNEGLSVNRLVDLYTGENPNPILQRQLVWRSAWEIIKTAPIMGTGIGTFFIVSPPYRNANDYTSGFFVHNDFLQFWLETGFVGLTLMVLIMFAAIKLFILVLKHRDLKLQDRLEITGLMAGLSAVVIHTFVDFNLYIIAVLMIMGLMCARIQEITGFYYSGLMITTGEMQINNFFSFLTAMMLSYQPIRSLATINMLFYQGAAGAERVFDILDNKPAINDNDRAPNLNIKKGNIKFEGVSFAYPKTNEQAIKNINISIGGGTTAALVGHSGAGKSTIVNLLPRFYDPKIGSVYIDEQNICTVSLSSLRKNISMVSQDIILFDDTVRANIAYANMNASEETIKEACNFAAATEFIEKLPQTFETIIGENGIKLSGGQKQRISIARAVLKNSPIILLDEATSSLDAESEEKVQNAVINLTKNKTTLVIAHRLSTIIRADKIIVMNKGEVVDIGTHNDLLKNSIIYKNLYSKQLSA